MAEKSTDQDTTLDDSIDVASIKGRRHLTLLVLSGPAAGQWHLVSSGGGIIGRHPSCDVMVDDPAISRRQAAVSQRPDGTHWLRDLGSRNGTYIGGHRIDEAPLSDGDQIQLSSASVMRVRYLGAQETLLLHQLQEAATTDALTGVANRRYLMLRLSQELSYAKRHFVPLSVLMADLDRFEEINDQAGHQAGDAVLQEIAHLIESSARLEDVVARYGGDEFVIVGRGLGIEAAVKFGERLCREIHQAQLETDVDQVVAISIGVADYDPENPDRDGPLDMMKLLARADAAVFEAKRRGRNRVATWSGATPTPPEDKMRPTQRNPVLTLPELPEIEEP